jgi:hypothetical protein
MRPYGKEIKMGNKPREVEDAHRKSTARQLSKKEINQQYLEYVAETNKHNRLTIFEVHGKFT